MNNMKNRQESLNKDDLIKAFDSIQYVPETQTQNLTDKVLRKPIIRKGLFANKLLVTAMSIFLVISLVVGSVLLTKHGTGIAVYAEDLMKGIEATSVEEREIDERFAEAVIDFSLELFKRGREEGVNSLISPLSVYIALAMAANGSDRTTRTQFEDVLGKGISVEDINGYIYSLVKDLPNEEDAIVDIVNSIWFDDEAVTPYKEFLQTNANYYGAGMFKTDFSNKNTLGKINDWIKDATNGLIEEGVKKIEPDDVMYLINTLLFDEKWSSDQLYKLTDTPADIRSFYVNENEKVEVEFMKGKFKYIEDTNTTGFIYDYKEVEGKRNFSFVALLPEYNISLEEYLAELTPEKFRNIIDFDSTQTCKGFIPKFKYDYSVDLKNAVSSMGLPDAFSEVRADFSKIGKFNSRGKPYISEISHSTSIEVNEEGTKAGAATIIKYPVRGADWYQAEVVLNRPFIYAIVDNETKIPFFIGTVNDFEGEKSVVTESIPRGNYIERDEGFVFYNNEDQSFKRIFRYEGERSEITFLDGWKNGKNIEIISPKAFAGNEYIEKIVFEYTPAVIGDEAFANCHNLKEIHFTDRNMCYIGSNIIQGSENVVIYCYKESSVYQYAIENGLKVETY